MKPADNIHLLFLDDEAILFNEPAQTLHHLNTTAAFIWCLLEDGKDKTTILTELKSTFGTTFEQAENYYSGCKAMFQSLEVLLGFEGTPRSSENGITSDEAAIYEDKAFILESRYRLLSSRVKIRYSHREQKAKIDPVLNHLSDDTVVEATTTIDILRDEDGCFTLYRDRSPVLFCKNLDELAPKAKSLFWQTAVNAHNFFLDIHAGVVGDGKQCFLIPAASGGGKSTLTVVLAVHGFEYFSDEVALIHLDDLWVESVPLAACIKDTGLELMSQWYPQLPDLQLHYRSDGKRVRYMPPPTNSIPPHGTKRAVGAIIFPKYDPYRKTELTSITKTQAAMMLMQECLIINTRLDKSKVIKFLNWIEKTPCFQLITTDLNKAVDCVQQLSDKFSDV